ncbi:MAG: phosphatase PAP2 family protein [Bacteroidota bacterium]
MNILKSVLVAFLLLSVFVHAQTSDDTVSKTKWQLLTYDFSNVFKGVGHAYTRPFEWQGQQWGTLAAVAAGTGLLYIYDKETSDFFVRQGDDIPTFIIDYGKNYGSPRYNFLFTGGVYFTGLLTQNEKLRRLGVLLLSSAIATGVLQQLTKSLVGRARPLKNLGKDTFDPFNRDRDYHSFPSGHTMLAFSNAYAIGKQVSNPWLKAGIYTIGAIPGLSRLWEKQHWLTDVGLGIAISIFTVESIDKYLDKKYEQKYNNGKGKTLSWNFNITPARIGITAIF